MCVPLHPCAPSNNNTSSPLQETNEGKITQNKRNNYKTSGGRGFGREEEEVGEQGGAKNILSFQENFLYTVDVLLLWFLFSRSRRKVLVL